MEWLYALAPIATAAGGYVVAVRRQSGRVKTSEAEVLWKQQSDYTARLEKRIGALEREVLRVRLDNHRLRGELIENQFFTHPDVPDHVKNAVAERQRRHVMELEADFKRLEKLEDNDEHTDTR